MLIGYARVSKADKSQSLDLQLDALISAGVEQKNIYTDHASGKEVNRVGLEACLKALRQGDTLVIWKLDRLGRSLKHLISLIEDLNRQEIGFKVLSGAQIDTNTSSGRLVFNIFASLAEFERELIRERTLAGLAAARSRGRKGGRPRMLDLAKLKLASKAMADTTTVVRELAKTLGVAPSTIHYYLYPDGSFKSTAENLFKD